MPSAGDIVVPLTDAWDVYTPTFTATTGSPAMGTGGALTGRYKQIGKTVHLSIYGLFGTTPTLGTGGWSFSLPLTASSTSNQIRLGSAYLRDASAGSAGHFNGICTVQPLLSTTILNAFSGVAQVGAAAPFAWVATDFFAFTITYEAA